MSRRLRWLVTGAGGMLASDVLHRLWRTDDHVLALTHADLDVTDPPAVGHVIGGLRPDVVVNCAAWTDVDRAESHETEAMAVNGTGPRDMARACRTVGARLVHVSTDYVFAGDATTPYREDAVPAPRSAYGRTKLAGERGVLHELPADGVVVRTAWLYGAHGRSFASTMARSASAGEVVHVVTDQHGQPTCARDVADRLVALGRDRQAHGVFHATSSGETTWYGLAKEIFQLLGADPARVRPTTADSVARRARRPAYSVLGHGRWAETTVGPIQDWRLALRSSFTHLCRCWSPAGRSPGQYSPERRRVT